MVRRRRHIESPEYEHVLEFRESAWPGRCMWERYSAWKVERDRVFEGVKRSGTGVALQMIRAHLRIRRSVEFGHGSCEVCELQQGERRAAVELKHPRGWAHADE